MNLIFDPAEEVQELVWALIDEQATEEQIQRLEELLMDNREARQIYITCMQMHADLYFLLGGKKLELPKELIEAMAAEKSKSSSTRQTASQAAPLPLVDLPLGHTTMPNSMV